jgi:hypothetical protein
MSYSWLIDSKNGETSGVTGYLQVVSPNGLYISAFSGSGLDLQVQLLFTVVIVLL